MLSFSVCVGYVVSKTNLSEEREIPQKPQAACRK